MFIHSLYVVGWAEAPHYRFDFICSEISGTSQSVPYNYTSRSHTPTHVQVITFPIHKYRMHSTASVWHQKKSWPSQVKLRDSYVIYQILEWNKVSHNKLTLQAAASCCTSNETAHHHSISFSSFYLFMMINYHINKHDCI